MNAESLSVRGCALRFFNDPVRHDTEVKMRLEWVNAPGDELLNSQLVELSGYVVPFDDGALKFSEFLLVPFAGACIHVPPPPSNQIVNVRFPARNIH